MPDALEQQPRFEIKGLLDGHGAIDPILVITDVNETIAPR